jgi:hypothetical protein
VARDEHCPLCALDDPEAETALNRDPVDDRAARQPCDVQLAAAAEPDVEAAVARVPRQPLAEVEQVQSTVDVAAERNGGRVGCGDFARGVGELARHVERLS